MSSLPIHAADLGPSSRAVAKAGRLQERTELEIFQHELDARFKTECDRIDSQAVADVLQTALEEEFRLIDVGLAAANGSPAKAELLARKVELLANVNNRRIARRFGG